MDEADDETQGIANARDTRDIVLAATLQLAKRVLDHVDAHEGLAVAGFEETYEAGGYGWKLEVAYRRGHSFVQVEGTPQNEATRAGVVTSMAELAAVMGGQSAGFCTQVPRAWVEAAHAHADLPVLTEEPSRS